MVFLLERKHSDDFIIIKIIFTWKAFSLKHTQHKGIMITTAMAVSQENSPIIMRKWFSSFKQNTYFDKFSASLKKFADSILS